MLEKEKDQDRDREQRTGKDSRNLRREPDLDKDRKQKEEGETGGSEGRWREKIDGSLQTCAVCWVMLGHRGTNLY